MAIETVSHCWKVTSWPVGGSNNQENMTYLMLIIAQILISTTIDNNTDSPEIASAPEFRVLVN